MRLHKLFALSLAAATSIYAAGYKIPEQSLKGTALAAAYVANAHGADASYYNPANMAFFSKGNQLDFGLSYIQASAIDFDSSETVASLGGVPAQSKAEKETVFIPTLHYIIPTNIENTTFGISLVAPAGLSKRWETTFAKKSAEEFTLKIVELNPTVAYKINEKFAIGGGLRAIYSEGVVKSFGMVNGIYEVSRDMEADSVDFGYNLALTYRPTTETTLAATYRSNVDIEVKGTAKLAYFGSSYDGGASVSFPLPAALNLAVSHNFGNLTAELVYERTYWSAYTDLDFNYDYELSKAAVLGGAVPTMYTGLDAARDKSWKDTNTYRLGLTYQANKDLTIMGGFAIDETPVPDDTIGFELPDADAKIYSMGFEYKLNENSSIGAAYLVSIKDDRNAEIDEKNGTITNSKVSLLTIGYSYSF